jgi:hypothetical protein
VIFIHRFGVLLNTHLHFHCVLVDGVFEGDAGHGVTFHPVAGLDASAIGEVQATVRIEAHERDSLERLLRYCARPAFALERLRDIDPEHLV